jgi:DNA-binding NarL/FixJ family response regulator
VLTTVDTIGRQDCGKPHRSPNAAQPPGEPPHPRVEPDPAPGREPAERSPAIRLLIVDDHPFVRQGLELLFGTVPGVEVVGLAADGLEAVELAISLAPEVVLMDIGMPGLDGIEATRRMTAANPELAVIILTGYTDSRRLDQALQAGARCCLFKHGGDTEVIDTVLRAAGGRR